MGEYYANTSSFNWHTRIGKFDFQGGGANAYSNGTHAHRPLHQLPAVGRPDLTCRRPDTRFVGVFFPANGKFYVMGGRDVNNVEFTNPFEYDPGS